MAEGKKSFIVYSDWYGMFKALPDDVAGKLIKHIFSYVNDENPLSEDFVINALFEQVKSTLKRDLIKWELQQEQRKNAGLRSAEVRKQNATLVNGRLISSTVSVNDSVNDIKINNIEERKLKFAHTLKPFVDFYGKELIREFYDYWTEPNKSNTKFKQELLKTWSLKRRLETWAKNDINFNQNKNGKSNITKTNEFKQLIETIASDGVRR